MQTKYLGHSWLPSNLFLAHPRSLLTTIHLDRLSPHWMSHAGQTKSNTLNNPPSVNILESNRAQAEAYTDTVIEMYTAF